MNSKKMQAYFNLIENIFGHARSVPGTGAVIRP
jgi:hypothetical protein